MIKINIKYLEELKVSLEKSQRDTFPKKEIITAIQSLIELAKIQFDYELSEMEKDLKQIHSDRKRVASDNKLLHIIKKGDN